MFLLLSKWFRPVTNWNIGLYAAIKEKNEAILKIFCPQITHLISLLCNGRYAVLGALSLCNGCFKVFFSVCKCNFNNIGLFYLHIFTSRERNYNFTLFILNCHISKLCWRHSFVFQFLWVHMFLCNPHYEKLREWRK